MTARRVALCGSGRWSHVLFTVLSEILDDHDELYWLARHGRDAAETRLAGLSPPRAERSHLLRDWTELWAKSPSAAIIAGKPATHAEQARLFIERDIPVLIEKPIALSQDDAEALYAEAGKRGVVLGVNLEFAYASYLGALTARFPSDSLKHLSIVWHDPFSEVRYGATKYADIATPLLLDVLPHLWSIIGVLTGWRPQRVVDVEAISMPSLGAKVTIEAGNIAIECFVSRSASERERRITFGLSGGKSASFDFSAEPGTLSIDQDVANFETGWANRPRPLAGALSQFLSVAHGETDQADWLLDAARCAGHVNLALDATAKLDSATARELASQISSQDDNALSEAFVDGICDALAPELAKQGFAEVVQSISADRSAARDLADAALAFILNGGADDLPLPGGQTLASPSCLRLIAEKLNDPLV